MAFRAIRPGEEVIPFQDARAQILEHGNIDLTNRPKVRNKDGSISTVKSMSVNMDGREVLIPTVSDDGRMMSSAEAINQYRRTGQHLGIFPSADAATAYAKTLSAQQDALYSEAPKAKARFRPITSDDRIIPIEREGSEPGKGVAARLGQSAVTGATSVVDLAQLAASRGRSLGLPEDETWGGKVRGALASRGLAREGPPESFPERVAEFAGSAAVPMAGLGARGASLARTGVAEGRNILDKLALSAARNPGTTAATELLGALGAAGGEEYAESDAPDSEIAKILAPLLGGLVAPMALTSPTVKAGQFAAGKLNDAYQGVRGTGAPARAVDRLSTLAGPDWKSKLDEESLLPLSLGQRMESPEMVGVERRIAESNPEFAAKLAAQEKAARESARGAALGDLEEGDAASALRARRKTLVRRRDSETSRLGGQADGARSALGDPADLPALGARTKANIDEADELAQQVEDAAWAGVNKSLPITYDSTIKGYDDLIAGLGRDTPKSKIVPAWIENRINAYKRGQLPEEGSKLILPEGVTRELAEAPPFRTVGDLTEFRSFILEESRIARSVGERKKAAFLNRLQASILDDLEDVPGLENARLVSRERNETFRQGKIGQLLGHEDTGEASVAAEATMRSIFSGSREQVAANIGALERASPQSLTVVEDFLRTEFLNTVFEKGKAVPQAYKQFVGDSKYAEALKRFPNLRQKLMNADEAQRLYDRSEKLKGNVVQSLKDKNKSVLSLYLDADPGKEIASVMDDARPYFKMRKLSASIKDPRAKKGLQYEAVAHVLDKSTVNGELGASRLRSNLDKYGNALHGAGLDDAQMSRLRRVLRDLERLETGGTAESIIDDVSAKAMTYAVGTLGARAGAKVGAGTSGAALRTAGKAASLAEQELNRLLNKHDKARAAVLSAIVDEGVFREMMQAPRRMASRGQKPTFRQTRAWILGIGGEDSPADE